MMRILLEIFEVMAQPIKLGWFDIVTELFFELWVIYFLIQTISDLLWGTEKKLSDSCFLVQFNVIYDYSDISPVGRITKYVLMIVKHNGL